MAAQTQNMGDAHVIFQNVAIGYGENIVFNDLTFKVPRKSCTLFVGPSGCGKTSILNAITAKIPSISGGVFVNDQEISSLSRRQIYELRCDIGMLFQQAGLFPDLTVAENIALPFYEHFPKLPLHLVKTAVLLKLEAVGLRGIAEMFPRDLSGGMARRVALARAVALDPSLILYDEPLTGQDPISCGVLKQLILGLRDAYGATSIIVSHQISVLSDVVDYICVLGEKKVLLFGPKEEVFKSDHDYVKQFLKGDPDGVVPFHYPCESIASQLGFKEDNDG